MKKFRIRAIALPLLPILFCFLGIIACEEKNEVSVTPPPPPPDPVDTLPGKWQDVFVDNFDNTMDFSKWKAAKRKDYNSDTCTYVSSALSIKSIDDKSCLCITATSTPTGFQSAFIETIPTFKPGNNEEYHFIASIKLIAEDEEGKTRGFSETYGAWPAFWTVKGNGWPTGGEIDIMEGYSYGPGRATKMGSNLFFGTTMNKNLLNNKFEKHNIKYSEGWHTYEMFWKNEEGKITVTIMFDSVMTASYTNTTDVPELQLEKFGPHEMVLNLNVGDNYGIFDNSKINLFSKTMMFVDFAKVEKRSL